MAFDFTAEVKPDGRTSSLNTAIREAIGAASVCWLHENGARFFDDQQALEIADRLHGFVREWATTNNNLDVQIADALTEVGRTAKSQPSIDDQGLKLEILKTIGYPSLEVLNAAYRWVKGDN